MKNCIQQLGTVEAIEKASLRIGFSLSILEYVKLPGIKNLKFNSSIAQVLLSERNNAIGCLSMCLKALRKMEKS